MTGRWNRRNLFTTRSSIMDFRPLNDTERRQLINALRGNAESDRAILMDRRDTSFIGTADEVTDEEVISAIKSVPCHYGGANRPSALSPMKPAASSGREP